MDLKSNHNLPLISNNDKDLIIDLIPPPELHLMLGVVNKIVDHMEIDNSKLTLKFLKEIKIAREVTNGGTGFNVCIS